MAVAELPGRRPGLAAGLLPGLAAGLLPAGRPGGVNPEAAPLPAAGEAGLEPAAAAAEGCRCAWSTKGQRVVSSAPEAVRVSDTFALVRKNGVSNRAYASERAAAPR